MLSAGEVSGDIHGAHLARQLLNLDPDLYLFGMGGLQMMESGVNVRYNMTERGTIGLIETLKHIPAHLKTFSAMKKWLRAEKPNLLILIDSQGFNLPLAEFAKKHKIKTVYYIAPQEWLWGSRKNLIKVAQTLDNIIAIFKKEYELYKEVGAKVEYFGNPLVDIVIPQMTKEEAYKWYRVDPSRPVVGLLPGSRHQEIEKLLPVALEAAKIIKAKIPNVQFLLSVSSPVFRKKIETITGKYSIPYTLIDRHSADLMQISNLLIAASGTVTLEAAYLGTPAITFYKLSPLTVYIARNLLHISVKYISLPNIIMDKYVIPEYPQEKCRPELIAEKAIEILTHPEIQAKMKEEFNKLHAELGKPGVIKKVAEFVLGLT
jgi:lipid-A-disaccharide synthase